MEHRPVVIVGAGLAGLAAAWRLAARGVAVCVIERDTRPGGRAASREWDGLDLHPAAFRVASSDVRLLGLVREAGLADALLPLRPVTRAQLHRGLALRIEPTGLLGVARLPGVRPLEAVRLARLPRLMRRYRSLLDPECPERAALLDDRSVADFGRLYFGPSLVARWMEPELAERIPEDERRTSRVAFLLHHAAEHFALSGTFREPVARLAMALGARVPLRLGSDVERLEGGSGDGFVLSLRGSDARERLAAQAVVLATPAPDALRVAAPLLGHAERTFLAETEYAAALAWAVAMERPLVTHASRVRVPRQESPALAVAALEPVGGEPNGRPHAVLLARPGWSRARLDTADDAIAKELGAELAPWLPGAREAVANARAQRFPLAYPGFPVGRYQAIARFRRVQRDRRVGGRRLYFAGDYLVAPTLEGAVVSGLRAADQLLRDLSGPSPSAAVRDGRAPDFTRRAAPP